MNNLASAFLSILILSFGRWSEARNFANANVSNPGNAVVGVSAAAGGVVAGNAAAGNVSVSDPVRIDRSVALERREAPVETLATRQAQVASPAAELALSAVLAQPEAIRPASILEDGEAGRARLRARDASREGDSAGVGNGAMLRTFVGRVAKGDPGAGYAAGDILYSGAAARPDAVPVRAAGSDSGFTLKRVAASMLVLGTAVTSSFGADGDVPAAAMRDGPVETNPFLAAAMLLGVIGLVLLPIKMAIRNAQLDAHRKRQATRVFPSNEPPEENLAIRAATRIYGTTFVIVATAALAHPFVAGLSALAAYEWGAALSMALLLAESAYRYARYQLGLDGPGLQAQWDSKGRVVQSVAKIAIGLFSLGIGFLFYQAFLENGFPALPILGFMAAAILAPKPKIIRG